MYGSIHRSCNVSKWAYSCHILFVLMGVLAPILHRESTDSMLIAYTILQLHYSKREFLSASVRLSLEGFLWCFEGSHRPVTVRFPHKISSEGCHFLISPRTTAIIGGGDGHINPPSCTDLYNITDMYSSFSV